MHVKYYEFSTCFIFIVGGNLGSYFTVNSATGDILNANPNALDYESIKTFNFIATAKDLDGISGALTAQVPITITISGVNEHTPTFTGTPYDKGIDENTAVSALITTVTATDADHGDDGEVYFSMPASNWFTLMPDTGEIYLKAALDYETNAAHSLTVTAHDRGSTVKTATVDITITVNDINEKPATCTAHTMKKTLREDVNPSANPAVETVSCSQAPETSTITYSIDSVNGASGTGPFTIGSTSGAITVSSALDYESDPFLEILVKVEDGGSPVKTTTVTVGVTVTDVNEAAPTFTSQLSGTNVAENAVIGLSIATIVASDPDTASTLAYSFKDQNAEFTIDSSTGKISLQKTLDYDTMDATKEYAMVVVATDDGTVDAVRSFTHSFTVTVTDINDIAPAFSNDYYWGSIAENMATGTTVTTISATDTETGSITYSLETGNTGNVFRVDTVSGEGKVVVDDVTNLDYETLVSYSLGVRATDGSQISDAQVTVTVNPINEHTPIFTPGSTYNVNTPENTALDTSIGKVTATDADDGQDKLIVYSISGPAGIENVFSVHPSNGDIRLVGSLDRETFGSHTITILGTDLGITPGPLTGTATVSVTVDDVNDVTPAFSPAVYTKILPESVAAITSVIHLACTDADGPSITYSVAAGGSSKFTVNSGTGLVETVASPAFDFDSVTKSYTETILATDGATTGTATVIVYLSGKH